MKNNYPQCDELSCSPDHHPGEPCLPEALNLMLDHEEHPCCQGHDPVYNAKRDNAAWPWLDNPYTCNGTAHPDNKKLTKRYLEEAQAMRAETAKAMQEEKTRDKLDSMDWMSKWAEATLDHAEENKRWAKRLENMQLLYNKRLSDLQIEYEKSLEEGYEEAYKIICEQRKVQDALQKELDKIRDPQMSETIGRQLDSLEIQED